MTNDVFKHHEYISAFASLFPKVAVNYGRPSLVTVFINAVVS